MSATDPSAADDIDEITDERPDDQPDPDGPNGLADPLAPGAPEVDEPRIDPALLDDQVRRVRTLADVPRLLVGLGLLVFGLTAGTLARRTVGGFEADLTLAFLELPDGLEAFFVTVVQVSALTIPGVAAVMVLVRSRIRDVLIMLGCALAAGELTQVLDRLLGDRVPENSTISPDITGWFAGPDVPSPAQLAFVIGAVTLTAPALSRPWRRATWAGVAVIAVLRVVSSAQPALDVLLACAVGMVVGAVVLLTFGSPTRNPPARWIVAALRRGGADPVAIRPWRPGDRSHLDVLDRSGTRLHVTVRTTDDRDADFLARQYRRMRFRDTLSDRPFSTLRRRVEHEAFAGLVLERAGARVPRIELIEQLDNGGTTMILAEKAVHGVPFADLEPDEVDDGLLRRVWNALATVRAARVAHRGLTLNNVLVTDDHDVMLVGLDRSEVAATDRQLAHDVTELLVALATVVGPERAVAAARDALGTDALAATLPLLQPLALSGPTRQARRRTGTDLDHLRETVREATNSDEVSLARLERVSPRTILSGLALAGALYVLLPQLTDIRDTADAFFEADWRWAPVIFGATALSFVFATISLLGASPVTVPFFAALRGQVAASFVGKLAPSAAGGLALNVRLLQRSGADLTTATSASAINVVAGFIVHLALMVGFFVWTGRNEYGGLRIPDERVLLLVLAITVVAIAVTLALPFGRRFVIAPAMRAIRTAMSTVTAVATRPTGVAMLLGGSAGITLSYLGALLATAAAFGSDVNPAEIGAAYLGAMALASAAPTPGGLGAIEAALVAALGSFGMPAGVAVSVVLTFRLVTFWVPVLPGWAAFAWMQRNGEL
ncbi:MAG: lysylphosphatidylglycerol synthase transmembrane domain-containing protein [Actinomycetota bacterium]|nr:lysylphosphatidylglycerol synthase transmembrane domain-containing protein [Actinomycetota bacterium]